MTITANDLPEILDRHQKWRRSEKGGQRANLSGAALCGADLSYADLSYATMVEADLTGANLGCADLSVANLRGAYLIGASLVHANLKGATLSETDLRGADLYGAVDSWASVGFAGHGKCGRTLTAIRRKKGDAPILQCGCLWCNQTEFRKYIADGEAKYRKNRTLALDTVLALLDERNEE